VWNELERHLAECPWYLVYDFAEEIYAQLRTRGNSPAKYQTALNDLCAETGIGWQMVNGRFVARGDVPFEQTVRRAQEAMARSPHGTASRELSEAIADLSRRPKPDLTGAVQHALAAVECLGRGVVGDSGPTLGDLIKRYRDRLGIPRPLDQALEKMWGYASEVGRHLKEGQEPDWPEAQLVVALAAALCAYLLRAEGPESAGLPVPLEGDDIPF
jgi:AbiJ N-terminal domain 4